MFLSKLTFDVRHRDVRRDVGNPYELHRTLSRALEGMGGRVLWRLETPPYGAPFVLVQSPNMPEWEALGGRYLREAEIKRFMPIFKADRGYYFRLRANPVVTRDGKRLGLADDEKVAWLTRKAEHGGFKLLGGRVLETGVITARRKGGKVTLSVATFEGVLTVTDEGRFKETLEQGIGPAKAFGLGMLSVAPLED